MQLDEYSKLAASTADYDEHDKILKAGDCIISSALMYPSLKLSGEAGEFAELIGKCIRDNKGILTEEILAKAKKELGDVLWYINQNALKLGFTLNEIAEGNIRKLQDRQKRGVIHGSGDER